MGPARRSRRCAPAPEAAPRPPPDAPARENPTVSSYATRTHRLTARSPDPRRPIGDPRIQRESARGAKGYSAGHLPQPEAGGGVAGASETARGGGSGVRLLRVVSRGRIFRGAVRLLRGGWRHKRFCTPHDAIIPPSSAKQRRGGRRHAPVRPLRHAPAPREARGRKDIDPGARRGRRSRRVRVLLRAVRRRRSGDLRRGRRGERAGARKRDRRKRRPARAGGAPSGAPVAQEKRRRRRRGEEGRLGRRLRVERKRKRRRLERGSRGFRVRRGRHPGRRGRRRRRRQARGREGQSRREAGLARGGAAAARGPVGTGGARARGARESSGSGRRDRREGLDGFQARARALEASQGRSGGAHAHRARRGVVPRRGGGTFPEEGFFVSFFSGFFLSSASEEALLHSAARL